MLTINIKLAHQQLYNHLEIGINLGINKKDLIAALDFISTTKLGNHVFACQGKCLLLVLMSLLCLDAFLVLLVVSVTCEAAFVRVLVANICVFTADVSLYKKRHWYCCSVFSLILIIHVFWFLLAPVTQDVFMLLLHPQWQHKMFEHNKCYWLNDVACTEMNCSFLRVNP